MAMRGLRSDTQHDYVRVVRSFAAFLGQQLDTTTAEDMTAEKPRKRRSNLHAACWTAGPMSLAKAWVNHLFRSGETSFDRERRNCPHLPDLGQSCAGTPVA
jgi:hypothetical protein